MKTYAEHCHRKPRNWKETLENKILNGDDIRDANLEMYSSDWVTCACGNMCAIIPRNEGGDPKDYKLYNLGMDFHRAIKSQEWSSALDYLEEIEHRSEELIQQIHETQRYQPLLLTPLILI